MKKLFYILVLITGIANAQIVNIPDPAFKNVLVNTNCVDTNPSYFDNVGDQPVDTDHDGEIQVSEALVVTKLALRDLSLTTINGIENFTNLQVLNCSFNPLGGFDLSALTNLILLDCTSCQLTSLNVNTLHNLQSLNCGNNLLTTLSLDGLYNLQGVGCANTLLTILDLGTTGVTSVAGNNNPNLSYVNLKNGVISTCMALIGMPDQCVSFNSCPLLNAICADEEESNLFNGFFGAASITNYCSFFPGGNYNTITGTATFDADNNGCDVTDVSPSNIRIDISDGTNTGASFTSSTGSYIFYTQTGNIVVTPAAENPTWFNISPSSATIPFADNNNNIANQDFCITANGVHPDLEVVIAPIVRARPGFDATYKVVYKNKGNQTLSGNVTFAYDDEVLDFVYSTVTPNLQSFGLLDYSYTNLLPFENRSFYITLNVNNQTDTPAVNIGDHLYFTSTVSPFGADENPLDNTFEFDQTVVGSFDPNDVTCIEGNMVPPTEIGNYLHYVINFENTGTADAENIVVKDIIDTTQFDVNSMQILNSSAPVTAKLTGNVAEFIFQNINLHSGGHGNILIKIKSKSTLVQGATVSKKASIYFDYNAPVDTNLENTLFQELSNSDYQTDASISVYPNPTQGNVNINCNNTIKSVQFFDVQGRLLQTNLVNENQTTIDISSKSKGVYFIKVYSDKGIVVQKIVKE